MTSANVSTIPVMPVQTRAKSQDVKSAGKDFMAIMSASLSQNNGMDIRQSIGVEAPVKTVEVKVPTKEAAPVQNADTGSQTKDLTQKADDAKTADNIITADTKTEQPVTDTTDPVTVDETAELTDEQIEETAVLVGEFLTEIKDIVANDLEIPIPEVENALDELELTPADLMDPKNTVDLFSQLTDKTGPELLADPTFTEITADLSVVAEDIVENLPIETAKEFPDFAKDLMELMPELNAAEDDLGPNGEVDPASELMDELLTASDDIIIDPENDNIMIKDFTEKQDIPVTPESERVAAPASRPYIEADEDMTADEKKAVDKYNNTADEMIETARSMGSQKDGMTQNFGDRQNESFGEHTAKHFENVTVNVSDAPVQTVDAAAFTETFTETVTRYADINTRDVIEQIVTRVRTNVTDSISTMALELHPATLGKLFVQVTEQDGTINARLYTENESVKQALENQMSLLKEEWEQQGTKVNAIEISVGTREFERQMETGAEWNQNNNERGNASGESGEGENENGTRVRSINLGDVEGGVPEDMSEAELLAASMMRDRGNRMSLLA